MLEPRKPTLEELLLDIKKQSDDFAVTELKILTTCKELSDYLDNLEKETCASPNTFENEIIDSDPSSFESQPLINISKPLEVDDHLSPCVPTIIEPLNPSQELDECLKDVDPLLVWECYFEMLHLTGHTLRRVTPLDPIDHFRGQDLENIPRDIGEHSLSVSERENLEGIKRDSLGYLEESEWKETIDTFLLGEIETKQEGDLEDLRLATFEIEFGSVNENITLEIESFWASLGHLDESELNDRIDKFSVSEHAPPRGLSENFLGRRF